jgi:transcriptional regulator with XRE-family HTH domain
MNPDWFGPRLRELREERGLTQAQLAEKAGMTKDGLAFLERSERAPAWATALSLAAALGVDCTAFTTPPAERQAAGRGRPRKVTGEAAVPSGTTKPRQKKARRK